MAWRILWGELRLHWWVVSLVAFLWIGLGGCSSDDVTGPRPREDLRSQFNLIPLGSIPYPSNNPPDAKRVELGRQLFFDPLLSGRKDISCGHCHHPALAWGDGRNRGIGVTGFVPGVGPAGVGPDRMYAEPETFLETPRNTPSCMNAGCSAHSGGMPDHMGLQFWDGRANGLEDQSVLPITSFDEMRGGVFPAEAALDSVLTRLREVTLYVALFRKAFPLEAAEMDQYPERHVIRADTYKRALSAYERELIFLSSPYDQYVGGDDWALTEQEFSGMKLFFTKGGCGECHGGPMLSNFEFVVTGVLPAGPGREPVERGGDGMDWGRWEHTRIELDRFAYRVPTLRNVALTGPYMHTGEFSTLTEVVQFYNRGGNDYDLAAWRLDPRLEVLGLTDREVADVVAFLEAMTDLTVDSDIIDLTVPLEVPSGLTPPVDLPPFSMLDTGGR